MASEAQRIDTKLLSLTSVIKKVESSLFGGVRRFLDLNINVSILKFVETENEIAIV